MQRLAAWLRQTVSSSPTALIQCGEVGMHPVSRDLPKSDGIVFCTMDNWLGEYQTIVCVSCLPTILKALCFLFHRSSIRPILRRKQMEKCIFEKSHQLCGQSLFHFENQCTGFTDQCFTPLSKEKFTIFWIKHFNAAQATTSLYKALRRNNINTLLCLEKGKKSPLKAVNVMAIIDSWSGNSCRMPAVEKLSNGK